MSVFVARQPIFGRKLETVAYELLFRSGWENVFPNGNPDEATRRVIHDSLMEFGFAALIGSNQAYVNITRDTLTRELYAAFPTSGVVLELTEDVRPDREVLDACRVLKRAGYRLALDDFVFEDTHRELLELTDVVKVDFIDHDRRECRRLIDRLSRFDVQLVAEKVEKSEDFLDALDMGYTFFQGFFFCKPEIVSREAVPGFKTNYLRFLQEVNRSSLDYAELEGIIKREVSLSVKLLRFLNSAAIGLRLEISSIRHALSLLGERRIKQWATAVALASLGRDKPAELAVTGLVRASFAERVGVACGWTGLEDELFLAGAFSVLDAMTGRPLDELAGELALPPRTRDALLGRPNRVSGILELARALERADWTRLSTLAAGMGVAEARLQAAYREAVEWADQTLAPRDNDRAITV